MYVVPEPKWHSHISPVTTEVGIKSSGCCIISPENGVVMCLLVASSLMWSKITITVAFSFDFIGLFAEITSQRRTFGIASVKKTDFSFRALTLLIGRQEGL